MAAESLVPAPWPTSGTRERSAPLPASGVHHTVAASKTYARKPSPGGYRITGGAPFVSNCHDVQWIATTATVTAGDPSRAAGASEVVMAYFHRDCCHVIDTWHVMGMRGTGSHDVAVTDVFVPTVRTFPLVLEFTPGSHYQGPSTASP